jgi:hypothetical protein
MALIVCLPGSFLGTEAEEGWETSTETEFFVAAEAVATSGAFFF